MRLILFLRTRRFFRSRLGGFRWSCRRGTGYALGHDDLHGFAYRDLRDSGAGIDPAILLVGSPVGAYFLPVILLRVEFMPRNTLQAGFGRVRALQHLFLG